jgi:hypothetical protein
MGKSKSRKPCVTNIGSRLWTATDVMLFLGIGASKFFTLRSLGQMVLPVATVGKSLRFHPGEVKAWACAGCPPVTEWEAAKRRDPNLFDRQNF